MRWRLFPDKTWKEASFYLISPLVHNLERVYNKERALKYSKEDFLRWKNSKTHLRIHSWQLFWTRWTPISI
ncbi:hypothetical protein CLOBOL_01947 [Enterocloster bolteae ATCC BAA-613]|uniref:Uncharacterized protein n=1 Tax=Enterocloster bolteae (strain ATCC BAA-613 / DSM 15670 / CCUG 46953 / JCM 12243 / WAL 16351) TaxID=411902 RepID=A8RML3_ENTBW|nr:hypothetical protein CLOBOL_01947 [Enterocloster bolteae ATCC BAA-613]